MDNENVLREQLLELLRGGHAHMRLMEAVEHFPMTLINAPLANSEYTAWRLLEHIRIAQWDIVEFTRNPQHVSPPWPIAYWPPVGKTAGPREWEATLAGVRSDLQAMLALVADPQTDLAAPLPHAPGYSVLREVLVLADHNAYHLGEFGMLRQMIEAQKTAG